MTNKITIIALLTIVQFIIFAVAVIILSSEVPYFFYLSFAISLVLIAFILRSDEPDIYKTAWLIPILIAPVFGGLFYLTFKPLRSTKKLSLKAQQKAENREKQTLSLIKPLPDIEQIYNKQIQYLQQNNWPYYTNTQTTFLPSGELKLKHVIEELKKAKKFIFLEYFILEEVGLTWENIYPILVEKANQGVDVRLIYDEWGSTTRIKRGFKKRMEASGIKTVAFNPLKLRFVVALNYRTHRKMIIIDGNVGFTGGINIADEYANIKKRFGHWHDAAVMLKGDAVFNMTSSFLETWDFHHNQTTDLKAFQPTLKFSSDGIAIPFSDSPFSKSFLSKHLYTQMIFSAKKAIYLTTPYFIIDDDLINAFKIQAQSGVEIHLIVPGIPDKKFAYRVTKYYLKQLVTIPNIYIYSYSPGFVHSKIIYIDDMVAAVGTVNFDFRSFYLHFENNVWFYNTQALTSIKEFLNSTIEQSKVLKFEDLHTKNVFAKIYETLLISLSFLL